jgi:hypothetical protein
MQQDFLAHANVEEFSLNLMQHYKTTEASVHGYWQEKKLNDPFRDHHEHALSLWLDDRCWCDRLGLWMF